MTRIIIEREVSIDHCDLNHATIDTAVATLQALKQGLPEEAKDKAYLYFSADGYGDIYQYLCYSSYETDAELNAREQKEKIAKDLKEHRAKQKEIEERELLAKLKAKYEEN